MDNTHEPNKKFVDNLEWQLTSEYRRQSRFKQRPVRRRSFQLLRVSGLILCSMLAGVVILKAAEQIKDSWKRDLEMARVETTIQVKEARFKMVNQVASFLKTRAAEGVVGQEELQYISFTAEQMKLELESAKLDFEEVQQTGQSPRNELFAPLVRGRDFVSQRLLVDKKYRNLELERVKLTLNRTHSLVKEGVVQKRELESHNKKTQELEKTITEIDERLNLRTDFLNGKLTPHEVDVKEKIVKAKTRLLQAKSAFQLLETNYKRMKTLVENGIVSDRELGMEYKLKISKAELRLAQIELDLLQNFLK